MFKILISINRILLQALLEFTFLLYYNAKLLFNKIIINYSKFLILILNTNLFNYFQKNKKNI